MADNGKKRKSDSLPDGPPAPPQPGPAEAAVVQTTKQSKQDKQEKKLRQHHHEHYHYHLHQEGRSSPSPQVFFSCHNSVSLPHNFIGFSRLPASARPTSSSSSSSCQMIVDLTNSAHSQAISPKRLFYYSVLDDNLKIWPDPPVPIQIFEKHKVVFQMVAGVVPSDSKNLLSVAFVVYGGTPKVHRCGVFFTDDLSLSIPYDAINHKYDQMTLVCNTSSFKTPN